jgi:single-strand DNA-binding protein
MPELNKVLIAGRLTDNPSKKATAEGVSVVNFTLAVNHYTKNKQEKSASFFDVVAFGNIADFIEGYLKKGSHVLVDGRLRQVKYKVKIEGEERMSSRIEIVINSIFPLDPHTEKTVEDEGTIEY